MEVDELANTKFGYDRDRSSAAFGGDLDGNSFKFQMRCSVSNRGRHKRNCRTGGRSMPYCGLFSLSL